MSVGMDEQHHAAGDLDMLTVAELERMFRVNRATVEGWLASGALPHYRLGPKTIRIARADLEVFLAERRLTSALPGSRLNPLDDASASEDIRSRYSAPETTENIRSRCSSPEQEVGASRTAAA
jgi:excisionase family DNA binding protein